MNGVLGFLDVRGEIGGEEIQSGEALAEDGFCLLGDAVLEESGVDGVGHVGGLGWGLAVVGVAVREDRGFVFLKEARGGLAVA